LSRLVLDTVSDSSAWSQSDRNGLRLDIEKAKIQLSDAEQVSVPLPGGEYRQVTRSMFEQTVRAQIERVREPIAQCLRDLGAQPSDIDAVVLVGGTCKIPAIRQFVADLMGRGPATGIDPMTAVAEGAAVASAILSGDLDDRDFFVSTEHALGTIVLDPESGLKFSELIPRNHKLPARVTDSFLPVVPFQEKVNVQVVEGDPEKPLDDEDNVIIKAWEIELPEPQPLGEISVDLTYSYDVDGILHVAAEDSLGNVLLSDAVSYGQVVDKRDLARIASRVERTLNRGRIEVPSTARDSSVLSAEDRKLVLDVGTKILPFIDDAEASQLRALVEKADSGDQAALDAISAASRKYSYLL